MTTVGDSACDDDIDNDGDGKTDFPADPGCSAPNQDDEVDDCPDGAGCPQCGNGIDDDGNGLIDFPNDPGCDYAADITEVVNDPVACGATLMIKNLPANGMDTGMLAATSTSQLTSTCSTALGVAAIAYRLNLPMATVIVASTASSTVDTVLDLRAADCDDASASIACHDDVSSSNNTSFLQRSVPAGNYFLVISGADTAAIGAYNIEVQKFTGEGAACTATAQCGPGLVCRTPLGAAGMVCTVPQCADTLDDDADGKNGFPTDPGCASTTDNDETDDCPSGPTCPACANGVDDDTDGQTDYPNDTACSSAAVGSEACNGEVDPIVNITAGLTQSTLVGAADNHDPTCGGEGGGDVLFTLTVPTMRTITIDTESSATLDTVLSLLSSTCQEPSIECDDDDGATPTFSSLITRTNLAGGTYVVAVDNYSNDPSKVPAAINLNIDGVIAPGGACDAASTLGGALVCPATNPCDNVGGAMRCRPSACGDGIDNDADNETDFPNDPGCSAPDDTDESDTCALGPSPGCPECADGIDNDLDGDVDGDDSACTLPSQPSEGCSTTDGLSALTVAVTAGTTVGANHDVTPACGTAASHAAPDRTYSITLPAMQTVTITNSNSFDAITSLYNSSCGGAPIACLDEPETISRDNLPAGTYFYVVDGDGTSSTTGSYTITVSGTIQNGGSCEGALAQAGAISCRAGYTCKGSVGSRTCERARCGDGFDNDSDGVADFPNDPGCTSITDDDEGDSCPGAGCPVCGDGLDNDMDGFVDYPDDATCLSASFGSETCLASEQISSLVLPLTPETTQGAIHDQAPSCSPTNTAPDKLFALQLPDLATLSINNFNNYDAIVALFGASCGPSTLQCNDSPEHITLTNIAAGTYYYLLDGVATASGTAMIQVQGTIVPGGSCESPLAVSGALTCTSGHECAGATGSRTCQPSAAATCADGMDNDSDGASDFPNDPGCTSALDGDEMDSCPSGTDCPVCSDGMDNDADSMTDFPMDTSCTSASSTSESCKASEGVTPLVTAIALGTTLGATNDNPSGGTGTCSTSSGNTAGDQVYSLTIPAVTSLTITNANEFDAAVRFYDNGMCSGPALRCSDEPEDLTLTNLAAGTYFYEVDGWGSGTGAYLLTVSGTIGAGNSCESPLVDTGALRCEARHACTGAAGARTCQLAACADGIDNDSDGVTDFPSESGCSSFDDNDETTPVPAALCSNTTDDDGDSLVDYPADFGCLGAGTASESDFCGVEADPISLITASPVVGTTTGAGSHFSSQSCQSNASGEDVVLALRLPVPVATLVLDLTNSGFDTIVSMRGNTCSAASQVGCADDQTTPSSTRSKLTVMNVAAGLYSVIIDGWSGADGPYELVVSGTVASGAACDSPLFAAGILACPTGTTCNGTPLLCQ